MTPENMLALYCPCCKKCVLDSALAVALTALARLIPNRYRIVSGYRCPKHNACVAGGAHSYHLLGMAIDVAPLDYPLPNLVVDALSLPEFASGGFGWYPHHGIIHLDVREKPASWCTTKSGDVDLWEAWRKKYPQSPLPQTPCTMHIHLSKPSPPPSR